MATVLDPNNSKEKTSLPESDRQVPFGVSKSGLLLRLAKTFD